nr:hypothetical protein CFP56_19373 [Quercus suber]
MPSGSLVRAGSIAFILVLLLFLVAHSWTPIQERYRHLHDSTRLNDAYVGNVPVDELETSSKAVIMGKLQKEDTSWVAEFLPEYASPQSSKSFH